MLAVVLTKAWNMAYIGDNDWFGPENGRYDSGAPTNEIMYNLCRGDQ
jgi:hypothetical protein